MHSTQYRSQATIHRVFISILFIALIVATTANTRRVSTTTPIGSSARLTHAAGPQPVPTPLSLERLSQLLGLPVHDRGDNTRAPVESALPVRLLGTLLADVSGSSMAAIDDQALHRARTIRVTDWIQGAQVLEIHRQEVIVWIDGRRQTISTAPLVTPGPTATRAPASGIRAIKDNLYLVPRQELDAALTHFPEVAAQARLSPVISGGTAQGYAVSWIQADSIYTRLGVQTGDVIRRVNGSDLGNTDNLIELYSKLRNTSHVDLEVFRNGAVLHQIYGIR